MRAARRDVTDTVLCVGNRFTLTVSPSGTQKPNYLFLLQFIAPA
jgi:hypothetical protein